MRNKPVTEPPDYRRRLGRIGEGLAVRHLSSLGYRILSRNHTTRLGEIDIVAMDGPTLVIVEVKTKTGQRFGQPYESIDCDKIHKLKILALSYLKRYHLYETGVRFDVVSIIWPGGPPGPSLSHFKNAFILED